MKLIELLEVLQANQKIKLMFPVDMFVCSTEETLSGDFLKNKEKNKQFSNREIKLVTLNNSLLTVWL